MRGLLTGEPKMPRKGQGSRLSRSAPGARPGPGRGRAAALALALPFSGCAASVLDPQGPVGGQEKLILLDSLAVMLAIVIPTILATLAFAWWFRADNARARRLPGFVYSGRIELVVWAIPTLTIAFLGGLIWIGSHQLDPARPLPAAAPAEEVQVVALDWKWLFIYPREGVASVDRLVAPAGRPLHLSLTSASVMNSFFVPQLGSQIYAMNGMVTELNLKADHPGSYYGQSAQFSGDGFSDMHFQVDAVTQPDFDAFVAGARKEGQALDRGAYAALSRQFSPPRPFTYRAVDPGLFQAVATQAAPPGPGPATGRGGPGVSSRTGM